MSVVITNYNYERYLRQSVESVLSQRGVVVDVVIVDDASTDGSVLLAQSLVAADPRVRLVSRTQNGGPVSAFNDGLAHATGEFVIRLDADDLLTPGSIARASALAEQFPGVGLVYGHPVHFADPAVLRHRDQARSWTVWSGPGWLERRCRLGHNCITSPEVLMRASTLRSVGGMRSLAHTHDLELWLRIARAADVGWVGGADQAWHREHSGSLSAREVDVKRDLEERAAAFTTLFTDGLGDPAGNERLLRMARATLANEALTRTTQAYSAGRGASAETDRYLHYARAIHADLDSLPQAKALRRAQRLGPVKARYSPTLLAHAVRHRAALVIGRFRWRSTGV
ncbi:glycosyltransferase family 2 protein [Cryobacterium luteum]|uniref:glycosyltransferase family 2 protein n=1 Tax=Cryobacterium luteum TaxID=1424661 RepID=UPI0008B8F802|nr:glycosyltransferase family A protein [Cryobacterium luteum]SEM93302.1 Glycosyl transferase family 2 [Cryobacterium luteum]